MAQQALVLTALLDLEARDAVVTTVRHEHEAARAVHADAAAGVHVSWPRLRNGLDRLHEAQRWQRSTGHDILCGRVAERKDGDLGRELVHHVAERQRGVELDVARAKCHTSLRARLDRTGRRKGSGNRVVPELPDAVHAEVRHVRNAAVERIQDNGMRVRVVLPILLRRGVVLRVVDVPVSAHLHGPALVGVVHRAQGLDYAAVINTEHCDCGVPIVHHKHVLTLLVQCDVARRGAAGICGAKEVHAPRVRVNRP
mmetsp:Transcript_34646/g.88924  ORF Transcript_34646/g.88924 Transcript_34646/m.88924 type:complete len:255 (-) Transcript_34646:290-1054(-)